MVLGKGMVVRASVLALVTAAEAVQGLALVRLYILNLDSCDICSVRTTFSVHNILCSHVLVDQCTSPFHANTRHRHHQGKFGNHQDLHG